MLTLGLHYIYYIICSQLLHFYIICYYLKLKQREVNNYLRKVIKNKERIKIYNSNKIIEKLHKIYNEINKYDSYFWSKFLAIVWMSDASVIALFVSIIILNSNANFVQLILFYGASLLAFHLIIIIQCVVQSIMRQKSLTNCCRLTNWFAFKQNNHSFQWPDMGLRLEINWI